MVSSNDGTTPVRISTIRKSDGHRAETVIGVAVLEPDHDIVGRSADAIKFLVSNDEELGGQQPHLHVAIAGLFACVVHRRNGSADMHIRSRVNWNPTHDLEIEIQGASH